LPESINTSERGMEQCYLHIKHLIFLNRQCDNDFTEPYWLLAKWVAHSEMPIANFMTMLNVHLDLIDGEEMNNL